MSLVFALFATLRVFIAISTGHFCVLGNLTLSCAIFWANIAKICARFSCTEGLSGSVHIKEL